MLFWTKCKLNLYQSFLSYGKNDYLTHVAFVFAFFNTMVNFFSYRLSVNYSFLMQEHALRDVGRYNNL